MNSDGGNSVPQLRVETRLAVPGRGRGAARGAAHRAHRGGVELPGPVDRDGWAGVRP